MKNIGNKDIIYLKWKFLTLLKFSKYFNLTFFKLTIYGAAEPVICFWRSSGAA